MKLIAKISIIPLFFLMLGSLTHAQIPNSIDGVLIQSNKENPAPGESVEISVESYTFDLSSASIVWLVDGKAYSQGIGTKKIMVTTPRSGVAMTISAQIKTAQGREVSKTFVLKTGSVDMIWETRGYTPPFFKGKIPFAYQNTVHIVAVPHLTLNGTTEIDPKNLVYSWKIGGKYIENGQGYGLQSVDVQADMIPKPLEITVDVRNREQTLQTSGKISIEPSAPSLAFYEESPLYGALFNKALSGRIPLKNAEMKIRGVPFGFNILPKNDQNNYIWSINNVEQGDLIKNQSIVVRTKGDVEGSSNINLDVRNMADILQSAKGGFTVYFSKKTSEESENSGTIF